MMAECGHGSGRNAGVIVVASGVPSSSTQPVLGFCMKEEAPRVTLRAYPSRPCCRAIWSYVMTFCECRRRQRLELAMAGFSPPCSCACRRRFGQRREKAVRLARRDVPWIALARVRKILGDGEEVRGCVHLGSESRLESITQRECWPWVPVAAKISVSVPAARDGSPRVRWGRGGEYIKCPSSADDAVVLPPRWTWAMKQR
ncbi:hypothetical protein C8Q73DRAFT_502858 [Cubamyces lactineus]|nr:hypothetical protein C8Q73DRAFT_502858 [Cubamyces lactineus]